MIATKNHRRLSPVPLILGVAAGLITTIVYGSNSLLAVLADLALLGAWYGPVAIIRRRREGAR